MPDHVIATLNGRPLIELRIELTRGANPSTFEAMLPPGAPPAGEVELQVSDAASRRVLRQFSVTQVQLLGDGRMRVTGTDRRREWQTPLHADINVARGDGTLAAETISAQAALERLLLAAGLARVATPELPAGTPAPLNVRARGQLGEAIASLLASCGLGITVDDAGEYLVESLETAARVDDARVIEYARTPSELPSAITVAGGPALELVEIAHWDTVIPDDSGVLRAIGEVLAEWGLNESAARNACLSDGGFEALLPRTTPASRLATLKRYAYRLFRPAETSLPWQPVGGVHDDGMLRPPVLTAAITRALGAAPSHPADSTTETTNAEPIEEFELDPENGLLFLALPPFALRAPAGGADDATLQDRALLGDPVLSLRIARPADAPPLKLEVATGAHGEPVSLDAPHLIAVYHEGTMLNRLRLEAAARELAGQLATRCSSSSILLAGAAQNAAAGECARVVIVAGAGGLTTAIETSPAAAPRWASPPARDPAGGRPAAPLPSGLHQPINTFRAGPLVVRTSGAAPESESVLAVEATHRRADTHALQLRYPGPLAFPFFAPSTDAAKFGRWYFVAGVEVSDSGSLRILAPDQRHAELPPDLLFEARHALPHGLRGVVVSLGEAPVLLDAGPLTADSRGRTPGLSSSLVYDLDGSRLSGRRRGGLQFLTVLALSPAHRDEGARDGGWVPALNLREGETDSPEVPGRGLFAESHGRDLGRLTAILQGGPVLADPAACAKHLYGTHACDDGLYRESAGHISTDAFFKIPGDAVHDAPMKFYPQAFEGAVPPWPPYEAQIKYDAAERHPWNRKLREGRWKIQYRVPFLPEIPPTWTPPIGPPPVPPLDDPPAIHVPAMQCVPYDIRPAVTEHELWAPSHDWVPAPSGREQEREVPYPGPSIKSQGWAGEADGVPDTALGGGCIYLPPLMAMPGAQGDSGQRQSFLVLHPEVVLAFGHPHFGLGRIHSGWALQLATSGGHLEIAPRDIDASIPADMERGVHIAGHAQVGPTGAGFGETQALRLGGEDSQGIAFGDDLALFRSGIQTLRAAGNLVVDGKLTVDGLIDPTGLELNPVAANPGGVSGNTLWADSMDGDRFKQGAETLAYLSEIGAGSGDMLAANNLSDVDDFDESLFNLISGATPTAPALSTKIGTLDAVGLAGGSAELQEVWNLLDSLDYMPALITPSDDHLAISRDNETHRILVQHFLGEALIGLDEITTPDDADVMLWDDVSETPDEGKKQTWANLKAALKGSGLRDVQVFTPANDGAGAWVKPSWATATTPVVVICIGGAGGGAGGGVNTGATNRTGGAGGGAGAYHTKTYQAGDCDATGDVVAGLGGAGAAGGTGSPSSGSAGNNGTSSTFESGDAYVFAGFGGGGRQGTGGANAGTGGSGGGTGTAGVVGGTSRTSGGQPGGEVAAADAANSGGRGGDGSSIVTTAYQSAEYGGAGGGGRVNTGGTVTGGASIHGGGGGGCGGGTSNVPAVTQPSEGGIGGRMPAALRGGGGAAGTSHATTPVAGTAGVDGTWGHGGSGGGGGGSTSSGDTTGADGGDGGDYGGGGGGGGSGSGAGSGGTGGDGGDGVVIVITG